MIYIYIILGKINRTIMNLNLLLSCLLLSSFSHIFLNFLFWKPLLIIYKRLEREEFSSIITIKLL